MKEFKLMRKVCFLIVLAACSSESKDKPRVVETTMIATTNANDGTLASESKPAPVSQPTSQPNVKIASVFSLYTMPFAEANLSRSSDRFVAISVKPTKVTSASGLSPSLMSVICNEKIITQTKTEFLKNDAADPLYQPSVIIPADATCDGDIKVVLEIRGFDVELGDVLVGNVVTATKAVEI
ncbi:MAG TPA: hypothetical protein V6C65_38675 [Allocoleopsis sp.]